MRHKNFQTVTGLRSFIIPLTILLMLSCHSSHFIPEGSKFLGQIPPGNTPEVFPLSVKQGFFAAERIAISSDNRNIYYSEIKGYYPNTGESIKRYTYSRGKWTGPVTLFEGYAAPALSVTGDTMYLENNFETFISVKIRDQWTKPEKILMGLDSAHYYHVTRNCNYYISSKSGEGAGLSDWCRVITRGSETSVISLGLPLNSKGEDLDFFVSWDESYIIVTNRPGLGISFRKDDGSWTNPQGFGKKIDFGLGSWGAWVTPDNRYMFYSTGTKPDYSDVHIYWIRVDGIIDSLKHLNQPLSSATEPLVTSIDR